MLKKSLIALILITMVFGATSVFAQDNIRVFINGKLLNLPIDPVIEKGTTLVPMRSIFESLGVTVNWDKTTQTVSGKYKGGEIKLTIGKSVAYVNGKTVSLAVPAKVIKGNTVVPLRFVAESLGSKVEWRASVNSVLISTGDYVYPKDFGIVESKELYTVNGTGKYSGYKLLKGYPDADKYLIYFKGDKNSYSVTTEDIRNIDLNKMITWTYNGKTYKTSKKDLHSFFVDSSKFKNYLGSTNYTFTVDWYISTFGDTYSEWLTGFGFENDAARWVGDYFDQFEPKSGNNVGPESYVGNHEEYVHEETIIIKEPTPIYEEETKPIIKEEYDDTWVSEQELESMMLVAYRYPDSILIYDVLDNKKVLVHEINNVPRDSKIGVVYEGDGVRYKIGEHNEIYFNRDDLVKIGLFG
ncbi:copper amine oxidase N-terminal domain-containing protein [Paenibacillus endoradicis]|uniref:copper amine oxidase N-terminal domain-containing protein n=1 Tax=Paenibacillus endoradicis TaxID=2972487 RepID=UPI002158BDA5|nr:copper amine oxidase N-terminal domain-containing protein [Paenibacillus endoradicis]MCR8658947.1 copper amine oxidase N-terminal domain-containing protein [Paenibacillus endoradicis]